jgi:hypothetical protein
LSAREGPTEAEREDGEDTVAEIETAVMCALSCKALMDGMGLDGAQRLTVLANLTRWTLTGDLRGLPDLERWRDAVLACISDGDLALQQFGRMQ